MCSRNWCDSDHRLCRKTVQRRVGRRELVITSAVQPKVKREQRTAAPGHLSSPSVRYGSRGGVGTMSFPLKQ